MNTVEIVGLIASAIIVLANVFPTKTFKSTLCLRLFNVFGSILFVIYGILLPAIATAVLNGSIIIISSYHLIILIKENKIKGENNESKN